MAKSKSSFPTVPTSELIANVASHFPALPKKMTKEVIATFLQIIEESVSGGKKVRIDKIGILKSKVRAPRKGKNPQTGEEIYIPSSTKVSFRPAKSLKDRACLSTSKRTTVKKK